MKTYSNEFIEKLLKTVENPDLPGIYLIENKSTGKKYVGQTSVSLKKRLIQHILNIKVKGDNSGSIDEAIQNEGPKKFMYTKLMTIPNPTKSLLNEAERAFITLYDSKNKGYNKTAGNHSDWKGITQRHLINEALIKNLIDEFSLRFTQKRVLLIGNFDESLSNHLYYENADVIMIDNYGIMTGEEILSEIEKMENKDFDIIISNPPYGKIGCEVTKKIIDEINYKDFINLLPVNDYIKRGRKMNLWQYVDINSVIFTRDFSDAAVTSHISRILKKPNLFVSADEFEIESYIDPSLTKFFYENNRRKHYAIDKAPVVGFTIPAAGKAHGFQKTY